MDDVVASLDFVIYDDVVSRRCKDPSVLLDLRAHVALTIDGFYRRESSAPTKRPFSSLSLLPNRTSVASSPQINSMTKQERAQPDLLAKSPSRRRRVALGSGRTERDVADLIGVFTQLRIRMQSVTKMMAAGGQLPPGMLNDEELLSVRAAQLPQEGPLVLSVKACETQWGSC